MPEEPDVQQLLGLRVPPVAVGFFDQPPAGVPAWDAGEVPAGCSFWQHAQGGATFYTEPFDHFNCAVGAYTHHIDLPPERAAELEETVGVMVETKYLQMEEVPGIPRLAKAPGAVAYGPVHAVPFAPDAVVVAAKPGQAMLLYEAALRAGAGDALTNVLGRPGCAVLPLTQMTGAAAMSLGCAGNRLFTGLTEDELYVSIPGGKWPEVAEKLAEIMAANEAMQGVYEARRQRVASGG